MHLCPEVQVVCFDTVWANLCHFLCLLSCILDYASLTGRLLSVQGFGLASCIVGFGAIRFVVIPCMVKVGLGSGRLTALHSLHRCVFLLNIKPC